MTQHLPKPAEPDNEWYLEGVAAFIILLVNQKMFSKPDTGIMVGHLLEISGRINLYRGKGR